MGFWNYVVVTCGYVAFFFLGWVIGYRRGWSVGFLDGHRSGRKR